MEVLVRRLRLAAETGKAGSDLRPEERLVCGKLVLRPTVHRAYWKEVDVGLTLGEYDTVHLLASNAGRYLTYRAIYDRMRYRGFVAGLEGQGYRINVRSSIRRIRRKFHKLDSTFSEIETAAAVGYRWRELTVPLA